MIEIKLIWVAIFNVIDISIIAYFGMKLIIRSYENFKEEHQIKKSEEEYRAYGSFDIFMDNLNYIKRHFWASFYVLEFALVAYFVFWGILFYYNATII